MEHENHERAEDNSVTGKVIHFNSSTNGDKPDAISGTRHNDVIHAVTDGTTGNQIHIYAGAGNDDVHMHVGISGGKNLSHGHHVFAGLGRDRLIFEGLHDLRGTIVGRLDDLDPREDSVFIGEERLDLHNPKMMKSFDAKVVEYLGQQWLDVKNENGGRLFFTLEGARSHREFVDGRDDEHHFLVWNHPLPKELPEVRFNPEINNVTSSVFDKFVSEHALTELSLAVPGVDIAGTDGNDLIRAGREHDKISAGAGNDLISAGFGNDVVDGGDGDDLIEGYKGFDHLSGGAGNDLIFGGLDADTISGDEGDDTIYGGSEDDLIYGGDGDDLLYGGEGDDTISSGKGRDVIFGEDGDDLILAHGSEVTASGGKGKDVYTVGEETRLLITDFNSEEDLLDISAHFADQETFLNSLSVVKNENDQNVSDLVITLSDSASVVLSGAGDMKKDATGFVKGWQEWEPEPLTDNDEEEEPQNPSDASGGGCFVVTASYGTRNHPDVVQMRRFRDETLIKHALGRALIRTYWVIGPVLAKRVKPDSLIGRSVRKAVESFVKKM